jgi:ABC-type nitrate/sulfonate/bicarbonate transport system substrate-binding protein
MTTIRQILFVPPAPIVWAQRLALFQKHGLEVETTQTTSSDELGQGLADGRWDLGVGVVDNVIAWNHERGAGLQIVAQLERSTVMAFYGVARYATLADAAAEPIAVDSTTNGFVLVLYRALAREGIDWRGCRFDAVGGVRHRFEALAAGKATSTILIPPFIDMAVARGFRKLWDGAEVAPAYPGVVVAAREAWLRENEAAALGYLRALLEANAWAARRENAAEAVAALVAARYADRAAQRLVRDIVAGLEPSRPGWDESIALRRECGLLPVPQPDPARVMNGALLALARS